MTSPPAPGAPAPSSAPSTPPEHKKVKAPPEFPLIAAVLAGAIAGYLLGADVAARSCPYVKTTPPPAAQQ